MPLPPIVQPDDQIITTTSEPFIIRTGDELTFTTIITIKRMNNGTE
jgi:hypothetical protein